MPEMHNAIKKTNNSFRVFGLLKNLRGKIKNLRYFTLER
jgi:hypothetical protein